jgi:uncharacterized protein (TIGR03437 family)
MRTIFRTKCAGAWALVLFGWAASAYAANISTTITVNATGTIGATITATGPATLTNIGSGTFSGTLSLTPDASGNLSAPFTISGLPSNSSLTGKLSIPSSFLTGTSGTATGSATITGGTGTFSGATGSFSSLTGSGALTASGFTLQFTGAGTITTGGPVGPPVTTPTITTVASAADYSTSIAQGSIFIVKGTNLSASGFTQFSFPLPTTSGGVTINFTPSTGGTGTPAYLIYTYNQSGVNQLAAILPSALAAGNYNVTVTAGGSTSSPFATTVVARKVALFTQDSSGGGLAVVQNVVSATQLDVNRFTTQTISGITVSPAKPGQVLIAWATGMGAVSGGDNVGSPGFNFAANGVTVQVLVGGMAITPAYAGRAPGLAGEDQINFTARECPHRMHGVVSDLGERCAQLAHLHRDCAERFSERVRESFIHHVAVAEFR